MSQQLSAIDILAVLRLVRRIAVAISTGRIEASTVETMTDEELAAFDDLAVAALEAKQAEAESLETQPQAEV